jgi:hypothetical protein
LSWFHYSRFADDLRRDVASVIARLRARKTHPGSHDSKER